MREDAQWEPGCAAREEEPGARVTTGQAGQRAHRPVPQRLGEVSRTDPLMVAALSQKPRLPAKSVVTGPDLRCSQEVKAMDHGLVSEMHCQAQAWLQWSSSKDQGQEHHLKSLTRAKGS